MAVLLQVNAGLDPAKSGVEPDEAPRLLEAALGLRNIRVDGLMTIAPLSGGPDAAAPDIREPAGDPRPPRRRVGGARCASFRWE